MTERQEKVWVVMRYMLGGELSEFRHGDNEAVKAFDDRKDGRAYVGRMNARSRKYKYFLTGVRKG